MWAKPMPSLDMIVPSMIPGAGTAGEPLPADLSYDMGADPSYYWLFLQESGKPGFSSSYLEVTEPAGVTTKADNSFPAGGFGARGGGEQDSQPQQGMMGEKDTIPWLHKPGLDDYAAILGGGSSGQDYMGEDNSGAQFLPPPSWNQSPRGTIQSLRTPGPGQYSESDYLPSVFV